MAAVRWIFVLASIFFLTALMTGFWQASRPVLDANGNWTGEYRKFAFPTSPGFR